MEKITKYYFLVEGVVLLAIVIFGLYDPAFLFYGIIYLGLAFSFVGLVVSLLWCAKRLRLGGKVVWPFSLAVANFVLFVCMSAFVVYVFSGGIHFLM